MAGTKEGARIALETRKRMYGESYYAVIGRKGGKTAHKVNLETGKALKGFAVMDKARLREVSVKGGQNSRKVEE